MIFGGVKAFENTVNKSTLVKLCSKLFLCLKIDLVMRNLLTVYKKQLHLKLRINTEKQIEQKPACKMFPKVVVCIKHQQVYNY